MERERETDKVGREAKIFGLVTSESDAISINTENGNYETAPLIKSVHSSVFSDTSSSYYDALESFADKSDASDKNASGTVDLDSARELLTSLMLPSTRISSYSSLRNSYDYFKRNNAERCASRSNLISSLQRNEHGVSTYLAVANLLPFLLGSATFALPYAVICGGYLTIPAFIVITILADVTGLLLVDVLYQSSSDWPSSRNRVYLDLVELGRAAAGKFGACLINFALIFYLYAMDTVNLVLLGRSVYAILHAYTNLSLTAATAIFSSLVLPSLFIKSLSKLAYLSMMSSLCILIGGVASQVVFIKHYGEWGKNSQMIPIFNGEGFAYALSVWFYMLICHSVVPQIEDSMKEPKKYPKALHISYISSSIIKIYFGVTGALTFGNATRPLVSMNIEKLSAPVNIITNIALAGFAVTSFPINFYVVCETFDSFVLRRRGLKFAKGGRYHNIWILLTRPILVGVGLAIALVIPYFGLLVGVLGSFLATFLVFVFPCWFYLRIKGRSLKLWKRVMVVIVMVTGVCIGVAGMYASAKGMVTAIRNKRAVYA